MKIKTKPKCSHLPHLTPISHWGDFFLRRQSPHCRYASSQLEEGRSLEKRDHGLRKGWGQPGTELGIGAGLGGAGGVQQVGTGNREPRMEHDQCSHVSGCREGNWGTESRHKLGGRLHRKVYTKKPTNTSIIITGG